MNYLNSNSTEIQNQTTIFDVKTFCRTENYEVTNNGQFFICFKHFVSESYLITWTFVLFALFTILLNLVIIILINWKITYKTVFDKIFIGHSIVDLIVGLLVIPNYLIYTIFGYWPLGIQI
jgi:hypothetical protein